MELNLPSFDIRLQRDDEGVKIFDRLRKKFIILTPEEWVRQHIVISQSTFDQIVRYNMVLHARYLIVSNGMNHYCCRIDYDNMSYDFLKEVPDYADLEPIRQ